jgi:hypothetical protein
MTEKPSEYRRIVRPVQRLDDLRNGSDLPQRKRRMRFRGKTGLYVTETVTEILDSYRATRSYPTTWSPTRAIFPASAAGAFVVREKPTV